MIVQIFLVYQSYLLRQRVTIKLLFFQVLFIYLFIFLKLLLFIFRYTFFQTVSISKNNGKIYPVLGIYNIYLLPHSRQDSLAISEKINISVKRYAFVLNKLVTLETLLSTTQYSIQLILLEDYNTCNMITIMFLIFFIKDVIATDRIK